MFTAVLICVCVTYRVVGGVENGSEQFDRSSSDSLEKSELSRPGFQSMGVVNQSGLGLVQTWRRWERRPVKQFVGRFDGSRRPAKDTVWGFRQRHKFKPTTVGADNVSWTSRVPRSGPKYPMARRSEFSILKRNPTSREMCKKIYSREVLEEGAGEWYIRNRTDFFVQQCSSRVDGTQLVVVRGFSGKWYGFEIDRVPHAFRTYCARLPVYYEYDSKKFSFDGAHWYITTRFVGPSRVVSQFKEKNSVLQVMTETGQWHKIPNKGKMTLLLKYASRLPLASGTKTLGQWHNNMICRADNGTNETATYALRQRNGVLNKLVAYGGGVYYARSGRGTWHKFKDAPLKFAVYLNRLREDLMGFNIDHL